MPMTRLEAAVEVRSAKARAALSWEEIARSLERSVVWTTSALLGQQPLSAEQIRTVMDLLSLSEEAAAGLALPPVRGEAACDTSEPTVYRLRELVQVYGGAIQELVAEQFGDGIMSAIDLEIDFERVADPKGDRVRLTLSGKFLPYRVW
jgi:cyanate lyase